MSISEVDQAIRALSKRDYLLESPGWCRTAAEKMQKTAMEADKTPPLTRKEVLVYPDASATEQQIHYALLVSSSDESRIYNPSPAGMFPQYIGDFDSAPGHIKEMKVTEKVL